MKTKLFPVSPSEELILCVLLGGNSLTPQEISKWIDVLSHGRVNIPGGSLYGLLKVLEKRKFIWWQEGLYLLASDGKDVLIEITKFREQLRSYKK
jgi:DNA-binding PadR family transcriptional regulator